MQRRHRPILLGLSLLFLCASAAHAQVSDYDLDVRVEPKRSEMSVQGRWRRPVQNVAIQRWSFRLSPLMRDFRIDWMRCGIQPLSIVALASRPDGGDTVWEASADKACPAGRRLEMAFRYRSNGKAAPQLRIGADDGFAGGGGELWYPQNAYADRETARISLDIPAGTTGIATGTLTNRRSAGARTRLNFTAAEPAKFAFAYGRYNEVALTAPFPVRVLSTGSPEEARRTAEQLSKVVAPLIEAFGPPPFRELTLVEVDFRSRVLGTSEFGMIFADRSKMRSAFDLIYWAHEFGHQWWGVSIRTASGSPGATLFTEGLAQYGALYALARAEGEAAAAAYKADGREGDADQSLAGYRKLIAAGQDRPLVVWAKGQDEILLLHRLARSKGASALDVLAREIGRERFHAVLRKFAARHRGAVTSWSTVEADLSAAIGEQRTAELRRELDAVRSQTP